RAVFAGIGQLLLTADKVRTKAAEQVWTPGQPAGPGPAGPSASWSAATTMTAPATKTAPAGKATATTKPAPAAKATATTKTAPAHAPPRRGARPPAHARSPGEDGSRGQGRSGREA